MNNDLQLLDQLVAELLHNASDCGDFQSSACSLVDEDIELLKRIREVCQNGLTVYSVREDMVFDYEYQGESPKLFFSFADAKAEYDKHIADVTENWDEYGYSGWLVESGESGHNAWYEAYPDGCFGSDHYACYLKSIKVQ